MALKPCNTNGNYETRNTNWHLACGNIVLKAQKQRPECPFFPATGYTFGCYRQLLTRISSDFSIVGMDIRPMWPDIGPPPADHNWDIYLNDLIAFIDSLGEGPVWK